MKEWEVPPRHIKQLILSQYIQASLPVSHIMQNFLYKALHIVWQRFQVLCSHFRVPSVCLACCLARRHSGLKWLREVPLQVNRGYIRVARDVKTTRYSPPPRTSQSQSHPCTILFYASLSDFLGLCDCLGHCDEVQLWYESIQCRSNPHCMSCT